MFAALNEVVSVVGLVPDTQGKGEPYCDGY